MQLALVQLERVYSHELQHDSRLLLGLLEVYDGNNVWVLQFTKHLGLSSGDCAMRFHNFDSAWGTFRQRNCFINSAEIATSDCMLDLIFFH